jgi:aminoglycoside phosphotransferase (APT) family kinase protein
VFVATARHGDAFVVKQAGPHSVATLAHEAAVLAELAGRPSLVGKVPEVVHHDPAAHRLVVRTAAGARDWLKASRGGARHALEPARRLGRVLAAVHEVPAYEIEQRPAGTTAMWALELPEPDWEQTLRLSRASRELVALIQAQPRLCDKLRELAASPPENGTFTHGDLRWENCMRVASNGAGRRTDVMILDWELAGRGDPAFDVGTVIAEYAANWIESIPVLDPDDVGRFAHQAGRPLARDVIGAFWSAYRGASTRPPRLVRVAELAGVRLLQSAIERTQDANEVGTPAKLLVSVGENMMLSPQLAAHSLLGLEE